MSKLTPLLVLGVLLVVLLQEAESLKCWHCTSIIGGQCGNNTKFDKKGHSKMPCAKEQKYCGTFQVLNKTANYITRSCFTDKNCGYSQKPSNSSCYACDKDYCNSALSADPRLFMMMLPLAICFYFAGRVSEMD